MAVFNSEADRNKYFNKDGTMNELGMAAYVKLSGIVKELHKYVITSDAPDKFNDWLVE